MLDAARELRLTRRVLTAFLLNFKGINTEEMTVSTLLVTLDYLADNPDEYYQILNDENN